MPFLEPENERPVVALTVPLIEDQRVIGLFSGLLDLNNDAFMVPLQESARFGQTGHAHLLDGEGRILVSTDPLPFLSAGEHPTFFRQAIAAGRPVVETVAVEPGTPETSHDTSHVMAVAPLELAPWAVALGGESSEIFAGVSRLRAGMAGLGLVTLIAIWLLTLVGTRMLLRPVESLTEGAKRIASGDLSTPLHAADGGEFGVLGDTLEGMRLRLVAQLEELVEAKENLEARVDERTRVLQHQRTLVRQLLRRSISAQEEERARIARELHDDTGQTLTAVQLNLDRLGRVLEGEPEEIQDRLELVRALTKRAIGDLRRIINDLRPGTLDRLGLAPALTSVAEQTLSPLGIKVAVEVELPERLPGEIETILFRIAQEAISNVARHSRATEFRIRIERQPKVLLMTLQDDGRGFNPLATSSDPEFTRGLGLAIMQERASLVGGQVTVESAPRRGTKVLVAVPQPFFAASQSVESSPAHESADSA